MNKKLWLCAVLLSGIVYAQDEVNQEETSADAVEQTVSEDTSTEATVMVEAKKESNWKANAGASAVVNTGNAQNETFSGTFSVLNKFEQNKVELSGNGAYGRAQDAAGNKSTNTKNWKTQLRYDRYVYEPVSVFTYGHVGQNAPAGFDWKYGGGTGVAHEIVKTDADYLRYELGYDFTYENRVSPAVDDDIHSARLFVLYTRQISEWANVSQNAEFLYNVENSDDIRINTLTSLTSKLTEKVGFQVGFAMRFDNSPVQGTEKVDTETQAGLVINFL